MESVLFIIIVLGATFAACVLMICGNMFINYYTGVPYAPTPRATLLSILKQLDIKNGQILYDLGCGDARLLFLAEAYDADARGFELSPFSLLRAYAAKCLKKSKVKIYYKNFFHHDLSDADVVFCFLVDRAMPRLEKKLLAELKKGAKVVSYGFFFPHWKHAQVIEPSNTSSFPTKAYVYIR